jgi:nucleoside-diphosphate-sugar epimerase
MKVAVIGADGFVGSAFVALLATRPEVDLAQVTRASYAGFSGNVYDVVVDASCNSRKYLADERPVDEFDQSVTHRLRTLHDFPARLCVHVSSVDVYSDLSTPETTAEDAVIDLALVSHYGLHKLLAEQLVRHYARRWLIVRLAGMVGPRLRKNPVYDILHCQPLRIHPDSQYQFMATGDVAGLVWDLVQQGRDADIVNICGQGLITPREIAGLARRCLDLSKLDPDARPRVVDVNTRKVSRLVALPETRATMTRFLGKALGAESS